MDSKEPEQHTLVKNKRWMLNGGQKKIVLGGPKEKEARKVFRKVTRGLSERWVFRTYQPEKLCLFLTVALK